MRKAHQQEARGLPGTPLRHVRASVAVGGHMPSAVPMNKGMKQRLSKRDRKLFYGPKTTPKVKTEWVTPPEGTFRQRLAVIKGKLAHKLRATLGRFIGR